MNKLGETNSPEWEKIKGWMGAANGKKDHPLVQEAKRTQRVQKFDEGAGDVQPDDETMKFLQPQGAGLIAPSAARPQMAPPVQVPPPQMPAAPVQPPPQMPPQLPPQAAPAPATPNYSSQAANELGTSPQELAAFIQKANTPTTGDTIRGVGASLADALGRAGGSNPNYLEQNNKVELARRAELSGIPMKQAEVGKEKFGLTKTLEADDPNSSFSKIQQNASRSFLKQLGASDADIPKIPASMIHDLQSGRIEWKKAQAELGLKGAYEMGMLGLQGEAQKTRQAEAQTREKEAEKGALEKVVSGSPFPFVGPTHDEKRAAIEKLGKLGGIGDFDHTSIPAGTIYKAPDGTMRRKS